MNQWKIKLSLFINYFLFAILLNSVGTVILQVQNTYLVSASAASVLEAFKDLSIALTSFLIASYVVRIGYRRAMLVALGMIGAMCLAMPLVPAFWMTKLLFAVTGAGFALVKVSVFATIGLVTADRRDHASFMSFLESFFMIGVLCGYFIFSVFINDMDPRSNEWLNVYYLLAALAAAAFLLLATTPLDESRVSTDPGRNPVKDFSGMLRLVLNSLVVVFIISVFLYVLIEQSIMSWLPTFNSRILNLSPSLSIQMTSILAASTALGRFAAGFVLRRVHWYRLLTGCLLVAAAVILLTLPLAKDAGQVQVGRWLEAPLAAYAFPIIGICLAPIYPTINSVMLSSLPLERHAPMSGLIVVFSALGGTFGSILTGHLFDAVGGEVAFYFALIPIGVILGALYYFNRATDPGRGGGTPPPAPAAT